MIGMFKATPSAVLRRAGHTWRRCLGERRVRADGAAHCRGSRHHHDQNAASKRVRRWAGPKAEEHRDVLMAALTEEPTLRSGGIAPRARHVGYTAASVRSRP